jgi:hypothetical protein
MRGNRWGGRRTGAGRPPGLSKTGGRTKGCAKTGGRKAGTRNKLGWHLYGTREGLKTLKRCMDDPSSPRRQQRANMYFIRFVMEIVRED